MRRATTLTAVFTAILATATVLAQAPSFAGKWTIAADPSSGGGFGALGSEATIKQDAGTMTITRTTQMGEFTSTYKLDGSESKNTLNFNGTSIEQTSIAKWDGAKLLVDTSMSFDGNPVKITMSMSLDPNGALVVESTRPDFQNGGGPVTTKTSYKKN